MFTFLICCLKNTTFLYFRPCFYHVYYHGLLLICFYSFNTKESTKLHLLLSTKGKNNFTVLMRCTLVSACISEQHQGVFTALYDYQQFPAFPFSRFGLFPAVWALWSATWLDLLLLPRGSTTIANSSHTNASDWETCGYLPGLMRMCLFGVCSLSTGYLLAAC